MSRWIEPVKLNGTHALLEPMSEAHAPALVEAASDGRLWELWYTSVPAPDAMAEDIARALAAREQGGEMPFVVRSATGGEVIGSTRYCNVDEVNRRLEIGYTWYARRCQRTAVNTECKLLLLTHAFETLDAMAVEFRTHWLNQPSRAAIARIGAKQDGVLRNHKRMPDGSIRDTVVFSVINQEWPAVRNHLRFLLERGGSGP